MRDTPERDLAVAQELGSMANVRIKELENQLHHARQVCKNTLEHMQITVCGDDKKIRDQLRQVVEGK